MKSKFILVILLLTLAACSLETGPPTATNTPAPTKKAIPSDTPLPTATPYPTAFGIDYANPEKYLTPGEQTTISDPSVIDHLRRENQSIAHLREVYRWLKEEFTAYSAGGKTIGVITVDQLLEERRLGGCNDHGLVFAAVVRELGYPAVYVHTVSIAWIEQFQAGTATTYIGHIFVEVYLEGKWILVDPTGGHFLAEGYDPVNPVIPLKGPIAGSSEEIYGFYVEAKGLDTWDLGYFSLKENNQAMEELAAVLDLETLVYPEYQFKRFHKDG
jgi:transglutaminase-like putative cysteine protease